MSASVTSDRSNIHKRGTMLAYIFSNQGWGSFTGSIVFIVVLECYRNAMETKGQTSKVDGVWRIVVGISLIPAFGTLYQRLTLPEATRYTKAHKIGDEEYVDEKEKTKLNGIQVVEKPADGSPPASRPSSDVSRPGESDPKGPKGAATVKKTQFMEFVHYFSEWRHFKILIGTCMCWFLLDIAYVQA